MKRASTLFLKTVLIFIGVVVTTGCVLSFPNMWDGPVWEMPNFPYVLYPGLIGFYTTLFPFLFALYQAFRLLQNIDTNTAFSENSIDALRNIKFCAIAMSVLYWAGMPMVFFLADLDDAPGLVLFGAAFACAPLVVATFAAVLQKLVRSAVDLKAENDLTV